MLGCELWHRRVLHLTACVDGVAGCECSCVDQTNNIAGVGGVDGVAGAAEHGERILGGETPTGLGVRDLHAAVELAGHNAHEG